jgi:uncharacterized protein
MHEIDSQSNHLLIFTRFPEVGQVKTRLIPALGANGATDLHRRMAEHTLRQAQYLNSNQKDPLRITVQYSGNPAIADLQDWLGVNLDYQPQVPGDLGVKLVHGFERAFAAGAQRVIAIGTDCPGLDAALMSQAFHDLEMFDVVLGPALDGGYYLIGVRSHQPLLFEQISWGTNSVLQATLAVIQQQALSCACLRPLADVDRPEDLGAVINLL